MTNFSRLSPLQLLFEPLAQGVAPQIDRHDPALPIQQQVVRDGPDIEAGDQLRERGVAAVKAEVEQRRKPLLLHGAPPGGGILVDRDGADGEHPVETARRIEQPGELPAAGGAPEPEPGTEACSLPPYAVGERVEAFSLPDGEGVRRNPLEATEEYVLLDFWASWCAPCRRELPVLLDAASRFDGVLSVCAVSVDEDAAAWRRAVEREGLSPLLNLRLDRSDASFAELVARFDIRTIPHNLLLDGERRVVAVDLRGDALREWLEQHAGR